MLTILEDKTNDNSKSAIREKLRNAIKKSHALPIIEISDLYVII